MKLRDLGQALQIVARLSAFLRVLRTDLQRGEIKFIEIVFGIFLYCNGELLLLFGNISFGPRQPAGYDMESRQILGPRRNALQCFSRKIDLTKPQRRRSEIELTVDVVWLQTGNLGTPGDCLLRVLFFGSFSKDVKSGK